MTAGHHWHPESAGSDLFLRFVLLAVLIIMAIFFEKVAHHITHGGDFQLFTATDTLTATDANCALRPRRR